jgi:Zn-dependent metalloprotease
VFPDLAVVRQPLAQLTDSQLLDKNLFMGVHPAMEAVMHKHAHQHRNCIFCIIPPYIFEHMINSPDAAVRKLAGDVLQSGAAARAMRSTLATLPQMAAIPSPAGKKHRLVYDLQHQGMNAAPGKLVLQEGGTMPKDPAVREAYRHAGTVYDYYSTIHQRNSLDGNGMSLISSVHLLKNHNNAYWTGEQMIYGDGDGQRFVRFTKSLDVVGHEFSHGVVTHTCNLVYQGEPGALNEHFADVFGVLVTQWKKNQTVTQASWTIGKDCLGPTVNATGLRTFKAEKAFENDPVMGTDIQPKHYSKKYTGASDYGGVHINSGIPNHAFYTTALELGGRSWVKAGRIWYHTLGLLNQNSTFANMVTATRGAATSLYGSGSSEVKAVEKGWKAVGLL